MSSTPDCVFDGNRCAVCGAPRINPRQLCGTWRPGLGDIAAAGLAAVGITPERVAAAFGVNDCGCEGRKELLNAAGAAFGIGSPPSVEQRDPAGVSRVVPASDGTPRPE